MRWVKSTEITAYGMTGDVEEAADRQIEVKCNRQNSDHAQHKNIRGTRAGLCPSAGIGTHELAPSARVREALAFAER